MTKYSPGAQSTKLTNKLVVPVEIGLGLLGTCRQLYHEAVLKPFTQISFATIARCYRKYSGVQSFTDALIPTQAKAIARLRIAFTNRQSEQEDPEYPRMLIALLPTKSTIAKLKGLTSLEIILAPIIEEERKAVASLFTTGLEEVFIQNPGMQSLVHARLRSLRVTMEAVFLDYGEDNGTPTFSRRGEEEDVKAWLRKTEMRLHLGSIKCDDEVLPDFGVVQDDETIGIPPWATPECLEKTRIEEEKENEEARRRLFYGQAYGT